MFFPERIKSIKDDDKVLEIGPGATPYFRSDVFLEKDYESEDELIAQSGHVGILETDKRIVTYGGGAFPFADKEFDYVVCSHVLEHVHNVDFFLNEVQRVGKRGYFEFPTIYYDYLYNFPEHVNFLFYRDNKIKWMTKAESGLNAYSMVQKLFYRSCELGYHETIKIFTDYFFQGFEWSGSIANEHVTNLELLTFGMEDINSPIFLNKDRTNRREYSTIRFKDYIKFKAKQFFKIK